MTTRRYARRAAQVPGSAAPSEPDGVIAFASGDAYPEGLPDMGDLAQVAASAFRTETLQYAPRLGLGELREWIASYLADDGVRVTADQIIVVNGAKHGLDLVCKLFVEPGDTIIVTSPTYMSALGIFRGWEVEYIEVGQDTEGLDTAALAERLEARRRVGQPMPKLLYDVTEFHNPTGLTTSAARRRALLELAERYDFLVVEDDPYRRIRFEGQAIPPILALDPGGRVVGLGTFAKLVAPGLRVGWVTAASEIVRKMAALKSDGGSCPLTQRLVLEYVRAGRLEPHIRDIAKIYRGHRDVMALALERTLPGTSWRMPQGGYYLWVRLPDGVTGDALARAALARGVKILPASEFYATAGPANYVRLAYSYASPVEITEGVRRLAQALEEVR
jgi:2-aminoadipate transaminase